MENLDKYLVENLYTKFCLEIIQELKDEYAKKQSYRRIPHIILQKMQKLLRSSTTEKRKYFNLIKFLDLDYKNYFDNEYKITAQAKNHHIKHLLIGFFISFFLILLGIYVHVTFFIIGIIYFLINTHFLASFFSKIENQGRYSHGIHSSRFYLLKDFQPAISLDEATDKFIFENLGKRLKLNKKINVFGFLFLEVYIHNKKDKETIKECLRKIIDKESRRDTFRNKYNCIEL